MAKAPLRYAPLPATSPAFWGLLGALGVVVLIGLGAAFYMEHNGHWVTGMTNQVVWGMPHVFAVTLIVAASGALNVASVSSVFGKSDYKPLARLSGLLAIALLAGGLAVLVLDLGRPDRLFLTMTNINPRSIFSWNILLYSGFFAIVAAYLWAMMDRRVSAHSSKVGTFAFLWRLVLTTGTGSIFGFLVARQFYDAAVLAPLFIALSLALGQAVFILVALALFNGAKRHLDEAILNRLRTLTAIMVAAVLYFTAAHIVTMLYAPETRPFLAWLLMGGDVYTLLFWGVQVILGGIVPLVLLLTPSLKGNRPVLAVACGLIVLGAFAQVYTLIIAGQAWPLLLFPGFEVSSAVYDGVVAPYAPTLAEVLLGIGGIAIALALVMVVSAALKILPDTKAAEPVKVQADAEPQAAE